MPFDSSVFEQRCKDLVKRLQEEAALAAAGAALAVQAQVAVQSPSHEEEYDALMVGEEAGASPVPLAGDRSGDTDDRIRFQKEPNTWLADVAVSLENRNIVQSGTRTTLQIGNQTLLQNASVFSYTNVGAKKEIIEHVAGPYFDFFEHGTSYVVMPTHVTVKRYPLRPDETSKIFNGMQKSIAARYAYAPETLFPVFRDQVIAELSATDFNS